MKKLQTAQWIVLLICVVGSIVFLILSPDRLPVHFDFSGKADRIGSKYELLILPLISIGLGVFFSVTAQQAQKKDDRNNEKMLRITGLATLIFMTVISFYLMSKAMRYDPSAASKVDYDNVNKFVSIATGALFVVLGNFMPKARRNAAFGLRTKWSMANDAVWQKSQRFGGITLVTGGFVMIVLSLFIPGAWNILMMTAVIAVVLILSLVASYRYYRADQEDGNKE
ncbi:MAG: SdpI family protein [Clostridia bacterium]|nr:SdpI family protein [Clostridia bacterium]